MTSPSDLSILRVYVPDDLLDQLHALSASTGLPLRKVVRGVLELGITKYVGRWTANLAPTYDDELSDRPYQVKDRRVRRVVHAQLRMLHGAAPPKIRGDRPYDETSAGG
jgi:hypothetical protein